MLAFSALLLMLAVPAAENDAAAAHVGRKIEAFQLTDYLGASRSLSDWQDKQAVVVVFLGTECPLAKLYAPRLVEIADAYADRGVAVVGINANRQDSLAEIAHYARTHKIEFPILKDAGNVVADRFGAVRTPEVFVLDKERVVRYWGRIDDRFGVGYVQAAARQNHLTAALDAVLAGEEVATPECPSVGCLIGRAPRKPPTGEITFSKHVAGILQEHCVRCHRPGEIAPFALQSYSDVAGWADTIGEVLREGRMPPWHANPAHGKFMNDARLPDAQRELILKWIANGLPEGSPADLPAAAKFTEGWQIPKPDVVYKMPKPFTVPAKGVVKYRYSTIDPGFTEDKWLQAAEARPGNHSVTHHLILFFHPPGKEEITPEEPLFNSIAAFAPGMPASIYPEGISRRIPAGSKLVFQIHYTPNGSEQIDQSEIGLVFADPKTVKKEISVEAAFNFLFRIPPGADNHRVEATYRFERNTTIYSLTPHMHLRGKAFRFEAVYPDKTQEVLLDVPKYDFNWQNFYILAEPKLMPEGTQIKLTAYYDNSPDNLANPDPTKTVAWGDQTWEEMMVGTFSTSPQEQDLSQGPPAVKRLDDERFEVQFSYKPLSPVKTVHLAGGFNEWSKDQQPLDGPDKNGRYSTTLVLKPGKHEYKFLLDGAAWRSDPGNVHRVGPYHNSEIVVGTSK